MIILGNKELQHSIKFGYVDFADSVLIERSNLDSVAPHPDVVVSSSPLPPNPLDMPGTKCVHGVYIPATHPDPDRAPYCSICYPYVIKYKGDESEQNTKATESGPSSEGRDAVPLSDGPAD